MGNLYETVQSLLSSANPGEIRRGLQLAGSEIFSGHDVAKLLEIVASLFYIDPLDRPDLVPLVEEAITLVAAVGDPAIPMLLEVLDSGDMKAQIAASHALGRIGARAIRPLLAEYDARPDPARRVLILYALGKIHSPEIIIAAPVAVDASDSHDVELRDTAARALGKFAEAIPAGQLSNALRKSCYEKLRLHVSDPSAHVRAKAVRSLGKFARFGHLVPAERESLRTVCRQILGSDDDRQWDKAYIVRKEAGEALQYCS